MQQVNSGSAAWLTAAFKDRLGALSLPTSVTYRVDCLTTSRVLRGATPVNPAATVDIQLFATDTTISHRTNAKEVHRVTVVAQYGSPEDKVTGQYDFEVLNVPYS